MCLNKIEEQHLLGNYLSISMLVLISNVICSNNVTKTSKSFTQLIVSSFQIKLPKFYGKYTSSSLVINLEVGEGMVSKTATPHFPLYQGN